MTHNDLTVTSKFIKDISIITNDLKACILSPTIEYNYYNNLFKDLTILTKNEWDLNYKSKYNFDIIIANNILHYSNNPQLWIDNIFNSCNLFLIQDLMKRQRSANNEYGNDGDSTRYSFNGYDYIENSFNISSLNHKIINSYIYDGGSNEYDDNPKHFICLLTNDT